MTIMRKRKNDSIHSLYYSYHSPTSLVIWLLILLPALLLTFSVDPTEQCQQLVDDNNSNNPEIERDSGDEIGLDNSESASSRNHFHRRRGSTEEDIPSQFPNSNNNNNNRASSGSNSNEQQQNKEQERKAIAVKQPGVICPDIYPVDSFPPKPPIIPDIFTVAVETIFLKVITIFPIPRWDFNFSFSITETIFFILCKPL